MSPSMKKRPTNTVVSKTQDQKLQDKIKQPISKLIERNRLKTVLRNLSLLKLLKRSNHRIQELHNLARRCWNSLLRVPKILQISSGGNNVSPNAEELQEARPMREPKETRRSEGSPAAPPRQGQQEPEVPRPSMDHSLSTGARERPPCPKGPRVTFLKTYLHRTPMDDIKQLGAANQVVWFEGLPTRIHLPGPRVFCRPSSLRWTKRCCTRLCSASLGLPVRPPHKVV